MSDHADLLRRAAAHARAVAEAATHDGRPTWTTTRTLGNGTPVVVDDTEQPSVVIESYAASYEDVLPHIALWHPQVALAVAAWLQAAADEYGAHHTTADEHAVAVARQLLDAEPA